MELRGSVPAIWKWPLLGAGAAAGLLVGGQIAAGRLRTKVDLAGKVVLITGGSRGLGLGLASELGKRGSRLALCARDAQELERARNQLASQGVEVAIFPCDVTSESDVASLVTDVLHRFGHVDILINNAGHISVGPLDDLKHSDFEAAMQVMFWAPVNLTFALLPHMRERGSGHIVNITSVGGRVSIPHLLPYCCAKFAFVGFSNGLNAELQADGIHVLTVVPGLMRTGSYLNAQFQGAAKKEFAWFGLLGNLPGFSVSAAYATRSIVQALERGRHTVTISLPAKLLIGSEALLPEVTQAVLGGVSRYLLPAPSGNGQPVSGKMVNRDLNKLFQALTALGKTAALALNE